MPFNYFKNNQKVNSTYITFFVSVQD